MFARKQWASWPTAFGTIPRNSAGSRQTSRNPAASPLMTQSHRIGRPSGGCATRADRRGAPAARRTWETDCVSSDYWPAPRASGPLAALVELPGSKSVTNRALVLAALADGRSVVRRPLRSRDTELMAGALRSLGVAVTDSPSGDWIVDSGELQAQQDRIDVGNAGTVARFVPPLAALSTGTVTFDGDLRVRERPLEPLLTALRSLGAELDRVDGLPVTITGHGRVRGGEVTLDASASSQLVSGLLLSAPRYDEGLVLRHVGPPLPSAPHLAMTVAGLRAAGAAVEDTPGVWVVKPGRLAPLDAAVEPDLSTAAAYLAAPLVAGGEVTVPGWPRSTTQPGALLPELLERMGARV